MRHAALHRRRRRRVLLALVAFTSLMAMSVMMGFARILHEMHQFTGQEVGPFAYVDGSSRNVSQRTKRSTPSTPYGLHAFSEDEAEKNAEQIQQLRESYHSRCLCGKDRCQSLDQQSEGNTTIDEPDRFLADDAFWNTEAKIAKCSYVVMDLGSNRGDTLQAFLNVMLSSMYSPSTLSSFYSMDRTCNNNTKPIRANAPSYQFDLASRSVRQSSVAEVSKRYHLVQKHHQLDMEAYLDLHVGRVDGESDPWMEFQLQQRMEQTEGGDGAKLGLMRKVYEEQMHKHEVRKQHRPRPEEYCFYGVEGNPVFTRTLRQLELMAMDAGRGKGSTGLFPAFQGLRPLRNVHFFTETVATSHDGPVELHLDSVSDNHVGSSLLDSHKYANMGGETARVRGVTLTWLLRQVLSGFDTNELRAKDERRNGGHLILKIDIEGGEYSVLKEALESQLLCDYAKRGKQKHLQLIRYVSSFCSSHMVLCVFMVPKRATG